MYNCGNKGYCYIFICIGRGVFIIDSIIENIKKIFILFGFATLVFFTYWLALLFTNFILNKLGFKGETIYHLVLLITTTSIIAFNGTLIINFLYQKIPFLNSRKFLSLFNGVHILNIYVSGLIAVISILEPHLLESTVLHNKVDPLLYGGFALIFFIIISNYNLYTQIVLENKFSLFKADNNTTTVSAQALHLFLSSSIFLIMFLRLVYFKSYDGYFMMTFVILVFLELLIMFTKSNSDMV